MAINTTSFYSEYSSPKVIKMLSLTTEIKNGKKMGEINVQKISTLRISNIFEICYALYSIEN